MKTTLIYSDDFGKRLAERLSDISDIALDAKQTGTLSKSDHEFQGEDDLVFICGSKEDNIKLPEWITTIPFRVLTPNMNDLNIPEDFDREKTILITPPEKQNISDMSMEEFCEICLNKAEDSIRSLVKLAVGNEAGYIDIDFGDFKYCFSGADLVDAFSIEKPDISCLEEALDELLERCPSRKDCLHRRRVLMYIEVPKDTIVQDVMDPVSRLFKALSGKDHTWSAGSSEKSPDFAWGIGFNESDHQERIRVTAAVSYGE